MMKEYTSGLHYRVVAALTHARATYKEYLDGIGGCDHSVGICNCQLYREVDELDGLIKILAKDQTRYDEWATNLPEEAK